MEKTDEYQDLLDSEIWLKIVQLERAFIAISCNELKTFSQFTGD